MNEENNNHDKPSEQPVQSDQPDQTDKTGLTSKFRKFATRKNLVSAGLLAAALVAGIVIGLLFANNKHTDGSQQPFSTQVKNSTGSQSGANGESTTPGNSTPGSKSSSNGSLAPSGGGSTTTNSDVATTDIAITNTSFSPASVTVKKGSRVTWTNKDSAVHALDRADGGDIGPHSQQLAKGESYTYSYSTAGTYKYLCILHPGMTGTVIVTD